MLGKAAVSFANGTIGEIIKALDMSGVEMLAISLPEAFIIDATQRLVRRWGCTKYDMIGHQLSQSPDGLFQARYIDVDLSGLGTQTATRIEVTFRPSARPPQAIRFKPQLFRDGEREFLLLIGQGEDAQPRSGSDEAAFELAARAGGYTAWSYDFVKQAGTTDPDIPGALGLRPEEARGASFLELEARVHPDDAHLTVSARLRGLAPGTAGLQTRYRLRGERGSHVWIEVLAAFVWDPVTGGPGKVFGLSRDVTAEMEARGRAEASARSLARSQAVARLGNWVLDLVTGEVAVWSDSMDALFGLDRRLPPTFDTLRGLVVPADLDRWEDAIRTSASGQAVIGVDCHFRTATGDIRRISTHLDPEFASDGTVVRLHGICHDVTDQVLVEQRLLEGRRLEALGGVAVDVAREFDPLLESLLSNLELAAQTTDAGDVARRILLAIQAVRRAADLSRRLIGAGDEGEPGETLVDLNALLDSMRETLRRSLGPAVAIAVSPGVDVWKCSLDAPRLERAVLELASRAGEAMPEGGRLTLETANAVLDEHYCSEHPDASPGHYAVLAVSDTGRTAQTGSARFDARGLAALRSFLADAGGHLDIFADADLGTTVRLFLPSAEHEAPRAMEVRETVRLGDVLKPRPPADASVEADADAPAPPARPVVLVVEDNDSVRDVAVAMVEEMGYEVLDASNGADAIKVLMERDDITLLLSDVVMAGMTGPELVRQALEIRPDLKVLFASGYAGDTLEDMQGLPRFIDLVHKPFTREELTEKVRNAVESAAA